MAAVRVRVRRARMLRFRVYLSFCFRFSVFLLIEGGSWGYFEALRAGLKPIGLSTLQGTGKTRSVTTGHSVGTGEQGEDEHDEHIRVK